ncbi:hypothetical protein WICMUC_005649 [Wickerhamomyces mucosus]|uniref:Alanyl-transfer RNA synthetases family profile domain-containing protein n=1 Tax=Wickerhamomyces mucosus TaxID=1378264 RepID=A0A9P8T5X2_9ASCO|nr:hypothetical protein WICMUC_005649 [Wickerhamomyces mucosus]
MGLDLSSTVVGALQCQRDSYLKSFETSVVSCKEVINKDKSIQYEVELHDTILFPEGGGQPSDSGFITDLAKNSRLEVFHIKRDKLKAIHLTQEPLEVGSKVNLDLNWAKRFDYMQQHTGQHLLSAILDKYDLKTLSWSMGDSLNYIEIPRKISDEEVERIQEEVTEQIINNVSISVTIPHQDDVNTSKIPEDYDINQGILRVIKIGDLDNNPCCGTHLSSTGQVASIVLLHQLSGRGGASRLYFVAGSRVVKYLAKIHKIAKANSSELSCQIDEISDKIEALNVNYRKALKRETLLKENLSNFEAQQIESDLKEKDVAYFYKSNSGLDYLSLILKTISKKIPDGKVLILLSSDDTNSGSIIIQSSNFSRTQEISNKLKELITNLKGGGKNKWQGKISKFEKGEIDQVLKYLEALQSNLI